AAATASSVAPSSRRSSSCRPSRPPLALMSPTTILATLAIAVPMTESGPLWSAMTPTLIGSICSLRSSRVRRRGRMWRRVVQGLSVDMRANTSGGLPISEQPLRLGELVATLALAQDNAFGQPLESQLRSCLLATWICEAAGFEEEVCETAYWVALLRFIGCTGHAHEVSTLFGDEIAIRGQTLVHDSGNPAEVMRDIVAFATAGREEEERDEIVRRIQETIREWAFLNFSSGCEVADVLVERLELGPDVREALRCTF